MAGKHILMICGDYCEDYETMVPCACCGRYVALQLSGGIPQDVSIPIPIRSLNAQRVLASEHRRPVVPDHAQHRAA